MTTRDWREVVPKSDLVPLKLKSAMSDLAVAMDYLENGAYAQSDMESLLTRIDELCVFASELRLGIELSAEARGVDDDEFERMIDEDVDE